MALWPWRTSTTTPAPLHAPSRWPSPRRRARCGIWASRATRPSSSSASPPGSCTPTPRCGRGRGAWKHRSGGVYLLRGDRMNEAERNLLASVARAILSGDRGTLSDQLDWPYPERQPRRELPPAPPRPASCPDGMEIEVPALTFANGTGGFADGGREYAVVLDGDRETPLPWVNVMANPGFGTVVSASGSAYTWAENSRENRLTPFANDPVTDPTAEALFLRDEEGGDAWSPTPGPTRRTRESARFVTRHAAGVSHFTHASHGILQDLAVFVDAKDPVKFSLLTLTNRDRKSVV